MEITIEELIDLELHDTPLNSIELDSVTECIELEIGNRDLQLKETIFYKLKFLNPSSIVITMIPIFVEWEIFSLEIETENDKFKAKLLILEELGKSEFEISFIFDKVQMIKI